MTMYKKFCLCMFIVILNSILSGAVFFLVIPEDVPAGFAAIYGFAPPITKVLTTDDRKEVWKGKELHGRFYRALHKPDVDFSASVAWLRFSNLFGETEGFTCAIIDEVILTNNYRRYIMKDGTVDVCQACHRPGNDHRFGFGFRLGNHADFQILYEFGPQSVTRPLQPPKIRSTSYRQRFVRRRPVLDLLVRAGIIKTNSYDFNVIKDCDDEPR